MVQNASAILEVLVDQCVYVAAESCLGTCTCKPEISAKTTYRRCNTVSLWI